MVRSSRGTAAMVVAGVLVALALMPAGAAPKPPSVGAVPVAGTPSSGGARTVTLVDDGSAADTGPQPAQPPVDKLKPGERPPQFAVFSWDGAVEDDSHLFSQVRTAAEASSARTTFFLRGIDLLPAAKGTLYQAPQHAVGDAGGPLPTDDVIKATLSQLGRAWLDGDEIGSGFNGRFCGSGGAAAWSTQDWAGELDLSSSFVRFWKTNTGFADLPPLPFDYSSELVGGRTPCPEGRPNLLPAEQAANWRYDASADGGSPAWPSQVDGLWQFAPQQPQTRDAYLSAFERAYQGNRAPFLLDTPLRAGDGGSGVQAAEDVMRSVCRRDGVRCVSFRELADWLDAQDPAVLSRLR
ncbi:hypothetical protein P3T36_007160 [Kitasatospora sp. MAP12-15]|uniref:hypothetical protein n=1 Tax=unclassified Kitasatospora TaxID=2633591 RepID=UPI002476EE9F|nr:hypothetical protein [Kitasatospora sp. MAP12-44]MDH6115324.1 hypothetical protein [Kitasatospora sp. MAP12-44]